MITVKQISVLGLLTFFEISGGTFAQESPFDPLLVEPASQITEHVEVFTDRSLYVAAETIHFRADLRTQGLESGRAWSKVLYAELVTAEGLALNRAKFLIKDGAFQGELSIPGHLLSGNYFLKCYTRWMRNRGPDGYSYTPIRIIHPHRSQLEGDQSEDTLGVHWGRSSYKSGGIDIKLAVNDLKRGEEAVLELVLEDGDPASEISCCLTLVPEQTFKSLEGQLFPEETFRAAKDFKLEFLPDLFGPTLSGRANPGQSIHLSLLGERPDYYVTVADEFGRFVVSIPDRSGAQELFVAPESEPHLNAEVQVDQDFDPEGSRLSCPSFRLSAQEREMATLMARRVQLRKVFTGKIPDTVRNDHAFFPFYGKPSFTLELNEFISLPTLSEVFINLVPDVSVSKRKNQYRLIIQGENPALKIYPPLLMVDQIPVFDHQKVLSIPPERIRRIDVINDIYVKGQLHYGGLIHVISHEEDMGGIDLPEGSYFFDFEGFTPVPEKKPEPMDLSGRIPDTRNTLLWIPDLNLSRGEKSKLKFKTSDYPGSYVILVRGLTPGGRVISGEAHFVVK